MLLSLAIVTASLQEQRQHMNFRWCRIAFSVFFFSFNPLTFHTFLCLPLIRSHFETLYKLKTTQAWRILLLALATLKYLKSMSITSGEFKILWKTFYWAELPWSSPWHILVLHFPFMGEKAEKCYLWQGTQFKKETPNSVDQKPPNHSEYLLKCVPYSLKRRIFLVKHNQALDDSMGSNRRGSVQ